MTRRLVVLLVATLTLVACAVPAEPARVRLAWRWRAPAPASVGMPTGDGSSVTFTYGHHRLVHLDGQGRPRWEAQLIGLRDVAPLLLEDRIVAATDTGMAAFARRTGAPLWDVDLGDRANTPVPVGAGRLAVTTWDGRLLVIEAGSGVVVHTVVLPGDVLGPAAADGTTAVATWDDGRQAGMAAVDAATGAVRWRTPLASGGVSSPAISGDLVVAVAGDASAVALDLASGTRRWARATTGAGSPEVPPSVTAGLVVADRLGGLMAVRATDGRVVWKVAGRGAAVRGGPAVAGPLTGLPVDDGRVVLRLGTAVEVVDPPGRVSGVAAGAGSTLLVATREAARNELLAYRPG